MKIGKWKKVKDSNDYYIQYPFSRVFLKNKRMMDGNYMLYLHNPVLDKIRKISEQKTLEKAKEFAIDYMKAHPEG